MSFDLSLFPEIGKFLFDVGVNIYKALDFNFGVFTLNGWVFLLGLAIVFIIIWLIGRISE